MHRKHNSMGTGGIRRSATADSCLQAVSLALAGSRCGYIVVSPMLCRHQSQLEQISRFLLQSAQLTFLRDPDYGGHGRIIEPDLATSSSCAKFQIQLNGHTALPSPLFMLIEWGYGCLKHNNTLEIETNASLTQYSSMLRNEPMTGLLCLPIS